VLDARARVYAIMQRSPLLRHPLLEQWLGCEAWVKHENHNPTGAFKIRGGLNLLAQLSRPMSAAEGRQCEHRQSRPVDRLYKPHARRDAIFVASGITRHAASTPMAPSLTMRP
jgi:threonine synthase